MNEAPAITPAPVGERPSPALPGHKGSEQMTTDVGRVPSAPGASRSATGAEQVVSAHAGDAPSRGMVRAALVAGFLLGLFAAFWVLGLLISPGAVELARSLPLGLGMPVYVLGSTLLSLLAFATFSLPAFWFAARDSDGSPQGGDSEAAPSRSDDSAGRNGIAPTLSSEPSS